LPADDGFILSSEAIATARGTFLDILLRGHGRALERENHGALRPAQR
jgi:hypothetical protein